MGQLLFQIVEQILLRLLRRQAGNAFQHFKLTFFQILGILQASFHIFLLFRNAFFFFLAIFNFTIQRFFLLLDTALLALHITTALFDFPLGLVAQAVNLVLGFDQCFFFLGCGCFFCVSNNALGLGFGRTDGSLRFFSAMLLAFFIGDDARHDSADDQRCHSQQDSLPKLHTTIHLHKKRFCQETEPFSTEV